MSNMIANFHTLFKPVRRSEAKYGMHLVCRKLDLNPSVRESTLAKKKVGC